MDKTLFIQFHVQSWSKLLTTDKTIGSRAGISAAERKYSPHIRLISCRAKVCKNLNYINKKTPGNSGDLFQTIGK
ncbi:hypothetical protein X953_03910 [Virgibacillus sp. SK37]|nr:hypothetical protein X953_03910 [Virgibacillus sp. SK37]